MTPIRRFVFAGIKESRRVVRGGVSDVNWFQSFSVPNLGRGFPCGARPYIRGYFVDTAMGRRTRLSRHQEAELSRAIREAWASPRVRTAQHVEEAIRERWYALWLAWSDSTLESAREAYINSRRPREKRSDRARAAPYLGLAHLFERADSDARYEMLQERAQGAEAARVKADERAQGAEAVASLTTVLWRADADLRDIRAAETWVKAKVEEGLSAHHARERRVWIASQVGLGAPFLVWALPVALGVSPPSLEFPFLAAVCGILIHLTGLKVREYGEAHPRACRPLFRLKVPPGDPPGNPAAARGIPMLFSPTPPQSLRDAELAIPVLRKLLAAQPSGAERDLLGSPELGDPRPATPSPDRSSWASTNGPG